MELAAIQIPTIDEEPLRNQNAEGDAWIVSYVDWLLNLILGSVPSGLRAEMRDPNERNVHWKRLTKIDEEERIDPLSIVTPSIVFRAVLARFGHRYLDGQLYGGACARILVWREREFMARFECSNSGPNGYWIEIHAGSYVASSLNANEDT